jgi:hypothetical protein
MNKYAKLMYEVIVDLVSERHKLEQYVINHGAEPNSPELLRMKVLNEHIEGLKYMYPYWYAMLDSMQHSRRRV